MIDKEINKRYDINQQKEKEKGSEKDKIKIFYKSQFHANYKIEEKIIKDLIYNNVKAMDTIEKHVKLHIYYKNPKTNQLLMRNSFCTQEKF